LALSRLALRDANEGLEAAVQERTAELQRANSEIQRFAYIVSHDLRSPLVNVMGFTAELEAATNTLREALEQAMRDRPETVAPGIHEIITDELPEA
ncbi:histidine kinase, partial [Enterococcus faecalis]